VIHSGVDAEESQLQADLRLQRSIALFNAGEWYDCHDGLEELWHETQGPMRTVLQGILQIAVAHLHLERNNRRGATMLLGEGLGRLHGAGATALGLNLDLLRQRAEARLLCLQAEGDPSALPLPELRLADPCQPAGEV
jgi:predicted metal-dependent hydrolase